ncbi:MAG TPA: GNAT family N-acetyltransferase [Actinomycetota bacterium]|jgi:GNAT superfamily N-acetyltransferase
MADAADHLAFAEDARALIAIGPHEERIDLGDVVITFSPGSHYWSTGVARVRFDDDVAGALERVRGEILDRGRGAAAWTIGDAATPSDLVPRLLGLGLESEPGEGSRVMVLDAPPDRRQTTFRVERVATAEALLAAIEVASAGFGHPPQDADDERRRAAETFERERAGGHTVRLLAFDGELPIATGQAWFGPGGLYLGGGATIPSHRRRGAMSALVTAAWDEAVRRGTPALVSYGNATSAPMLEGLGFRAVGRARHLIDRF